MLEAEKPAITPVYTCSLYMVVVHLVLFSQTWLGPNKRCVFCSLVVSLKQPSQLVFCMNHQLSLGHCFILLFFCVFVSTQINIPGTEGAETASAIITCLLKTIFFDSKVCQAQREKHKVVNSFCPEGKLWWNVTHGSR